MGALQQGDGPVDTIDEAAASADRLAAQWSLETDEVMEFSNHFYVVLVDEAGDAATELIVDRETGDVALEWGPAMMWNTSYGMMPSHTRPVRHTVNADRARDLATEWLRQFRPGLQTGESHAFPGYFTMHTVRDGATVGMLSVHSRSGHVWYHTWHGEFIQSRGHSE
ncbi:hypothetical protein GCM10011410_06140 [Hoyosella rhizosphaerae]|uniref:Uncharacterized protein n=2 Tax=Hoyosella rhizosphaerae TaxID=1755582 RepID=A0A916U1X2_9ACTN|nr:hypothetical protein GCM10011410_06140 [Hoyosella rhizosphaerae]